MAVLGALPAEHCVDDIIACERASTIMSGWRLWRRFADLCGWRIPDSKSPPPTTCQTVLGTCIDTSHFPQHPIHISITERRIQVIGHELRSIMDAGLLHRGLAGHVWENCSTLAR